MKKLVYILTSAGLMASCNPDSQECYVPKTVTAQIGFRIIDTIYALDQTGRDSIYVNVTDTPLNKPSLTSITNDTVITFAGVNRATQLPIMFNPEADQISYRFQPSETEQIYDTVTFHYTHNYHFISNACGYTYYYTIDRIEHTGHLLDSVQLANASVTLSAQNKHVIFYFID